MKVKHLFVDLFCGAGGTSSGIYKAMINGEMIAEVVACVNHDANAIRSHISNFKDALHLTEDIRTAAMQPILEALRIRIEQLEALGYKVVIHLWASLECTNFSRAKGGQSRDADSRTLAEHLFRYINEIKPHYVWIENVQEFMEWGPLQIRELESDHKKGILFPHCPLKIVKQKKKIIGYEPEMIPVKERLCEYYNLWIKNVKDMGYSHEHRMLNSADFGEHTSRKRYFGQFALQGLPIAWPEPTHAKKPVQSLFAMPLQKWNPVKNCLDFNNEGQSIFIRKKALSEKTMQRIYAGLIKYVAGGKDAFLTKMYSSHNNTKVNSGANIDDPSPTITTYIGMNLVKVNFMNEAFMTKYHGTGENVFSMNDVCSTLTTKDRLALAQVKYLVNYNHSSKVNSVNDAAPTVTTKDRLAYVNVHYWLDKQYSGKDNHSSIEQPSGSILSNDKHCLVRTEHFIDKPHSQGGRNQSIEDPAGAITTVPKFNLVKYWIMDTQFNNVGKSIEDPGPVITANRKHHYLINPSWGGNPGDVNEPCCTIVARQDKAPLYFVAIEQVGPVAVGVYEDDSETMILIKEFMALYGIVDIKMRMLEILELLKIQGFDENYVLVGTKSEQKKYIGNSVTPRVVKYLIEAAHNEICDHFKMAA